jgi:hypothetical protein
LVAAACSSAAADRPVETASIAASSVGSTSTTGQSTTTNPFPGGPAWPFTGLALPDASAAGHQAVVVKIDNSPEARPHTGINQADMVYELRVEGITRLAAVFHSEQPDTVGPVRSARSSDLDLVANLSRPLLAWSGGNGGVVGQVHGARDAGVLVDAGVDAVSGPYFRDHARQAPHNLYVHPSQLLAERGDAVAPPAPPFTFNVFGLPLPASASDAPGARIDFGLGVRVEYVWDVERGGWDRFQVDGRNPRGSSAFVDAAGTQVSPQNVVILFCQYGRSVVDANSPQAYTVGDGDAIVLTQGKAIAAHWSRGASDQPYSLTDASGGPVMLTPGRTWVALPQVGAPVQMLDAGEAQSLLGERR